MATPQPFARRLAAVLVPSPVQTLFCVVIASALIVGTYAQRLLGLVGVDAAALQIATTTLHGHFDTILTSQASSTLAVITFWAGVGLSTYLVCWSAYSLLIKARNEITLTTQYTNRGHWRGPYETLGLKAAGAAGLILVIALLKPGLILWLAIAAGLVSSPSITSAILALISVLALAVQLYLIATFALLTFTPWYRE